jgi:hypothetical protein
MRRMTLGSVVAALCVAALAAACSAGADEGLDTSRLPRLDGAKEIFANPVTTSFTTPISVAQSADAVARLLTATGWQQYGRPFASNPTGQPVRIMSFKKGPQALSVFVVTAPAQGNATSVSYTAVLLATDLPFPQDAADIAYDPDRPYLTLVTAATVDATLDFYRRQLGTLGWSPWSARDNARQAPGGIAGEPTPVGAHAYYVHDGRDPIVLVLKRNDDKRLDDKGLRVEIRGMSPDLLARLSKHDEPQEVAPTAGAAPVAKAATGEAAQLRADAKAPAQPTVSPAARTPDAPLRARAGDAAPVLVPETAEDVSYDAVEGRLEFNSASSVQTLAAFYRAGLQSLGWKPEPQVINRDNMSVLEFLRGDKEISFTIMQLGRQVNVSANGTGLVTAVAARDTPTEPAVAPTQTATDDLDVEETQGLPVPKRHTLSEGEKTPFRTGLTSNVPLDFSAVLAFYRGELSKRGWSEETKGAVVTADQAALAFATPDGPAVLKLGRKDGETTVALSVRNAAAAQKAGMLPKAGQAKLLLGNVLGADAEVTINKQTIRVAAGAGAKSPDGPKLDLPPGKYRYSFKVANRPAQSEEVEVAADETWGLLIGPGGVLPLHMY